MFQPWPYAGIPPKDRPAETLLGLCLKSFKPFNFLSGAPQKALKKSSRKTP